MSRSINESKLLVVIENTIEQWLEKQREPYHFYVDLAELLCDFNEIYRPANKYFGYLNSFCHLISDYDVEVFEKDQLIEQLRLLSFADYQDYFNDFRSLHLRQLREHRHGENKNMEVLRQRMEKAIEKYSKLLVVRVDLSYLSTKQYDIRIEDLHEDISDLRQLIHNRDTVFRDCIEYAWALEQGEDKGYHCHFLLVFNGHKRKGGWKIAQEVGERWKRITGETGHFFNCHSAAQINSYNEKGILGIGMIHRREAQEVKNMFNAVQYLVRPEKEAQHLRVKVSRKMRTFG